MNEIRNSTMKSVRYWPFRAEGGQIQNPNSHTKLAVSKLTIGIGSNGEKASRKSSY